LWWFILSLVFGLTYIFIVPPFQTPDEPNHFLRIYHISEGKLKAEISSDKRHLGGYLPNALSQTYEPYNYLVFKDDNKITVDSITVNLSKKMDSTEPSFFSFPNTARYAFTAYLPQVMVFYVLKKINCPPLILMYAGRLVAFFFWLILMYYAIQITPVYKEIFMLLSFLPTSFAVNTTLSADVVSNALIFVCFALFFKFKCQNTPIKHLDLGLFALVMLLISWQKIVYFPLIFLILLVPKANFKGIRSKIFFWLFLLVSNLALIFWWSSEINEMVYPMGDKYSTTYGDLRLGMEVNPTLQVEHILKDPIKFTQTFFQTSFKIYESTFAFYLSCFGWENKSVPSGLLYILMLFVSAFIFIQKNVFQTWERILLVLLGHGLIMLFLLSQHLHWDVVGDAFIHSYGGKYFVPIYPIFMFAATGLLSHLPAIMTYKRSINIAIVVAMVVVQVDFLVLILERYYF
jgi:uncharacterized membrane protein